ncbi:MAG TPA: 3'-5' exonuclease [Thermoanaerobaculia bacterium]|nr:3'-5' exonuclease [Thermoanaerobaculia bacterium]
MTSRLLFIDTETGGLDPLICSVLSVGLVVWEDGTIRSSMEVFIAEPQPRIDRESQSIHRIDPEWLRIHGLSPDAAVAAIEAFLANQFGTVESVPLAGHNVNFDIGFLRRLYRLAGKDYERVFSHRSIDTAGILRFLNIAGILQLEGAGSSAAFDHFAITFHEHGRHSALGDARATAELFTKLIELVQRRYAPAFGAAALT